MENVEFNFYNVAVRHVNLTFSLRENTMWPKCLFTEVSIQKSLESGRNLDGQFN